MPVPVKDVLCVQIYNSSGSLESCEVSTVVVVNKQIPLDRYGVWGMYSHLQTSLMQRLNWIIHVILICKLPGTRWANTCNSCWGYVLNDPLVGDFPRENHKELPPRQTLPSVQERSSICSRWKKQGNTSATWIYRSPQDQTGCSQECWRVWQTPFQGFYHPSEKLLL